MLETFAAPVRFFRGNLHGHSTGSDGVLAPADVCSREAGYEFVAISDHVLEKFAYPVTDTRRFRGNGFTTLSPPNCTPAPPRAASPGTSSPSGSRPTSRRPARLRPAPRAAAAGAFVASPTH